MRVPLLCIAAVALIVSVAPAQFASEQTLPAGFLGVTGGSGGTAFPQNNANDHKWQWHYDSPQFVTQGPITICGLAVRAENGNLAVGAFNFPSFVVTMATALTDYTVAGHSTTFAANLSMDATVVRTGTWAGGPVPASGTPAADWIDIPLSQTFTYDPTLGDFIVQIEKCGTTAIWGAAMDGKAGTAGVNGGNRYGDTVSCSSTVSTFANNEFVPLVRIRYIVGANQPCAPPPIGQYQVNSNISSLDVDALQGSANYGAASTVCVGGPHILNSISIPGTPTDIAVVFAAIGPTMPLSSANNVVNIDVFHPTMFSFNGGAPNFAGLLNLQPHPGTFSFPIPTGAPFVGSAQQLAIDPSNADGYSLSQASQITVTLGSTLTFNHADDGFVQAFINASPLCGTSVDFYGTSYTDIFSNSNGWASFTAGNTDFTATVAEWQTNEPRLGFGADLEPNNFGTVTLTNLGPALSGSPGASNLVMSYAGVTEWGTGGLGVTSYDIGLNGPNGHEIANFTTDGTWGATAVVAGMTLGAGGTHPAQVSFDGLFGTGLQANVAGTDSVLDGNAAGMLANASGWSNIVFPLLDGSAYLVQ